MKKRRNMQRDQRKKEDRRRETWKTKSRTLQLGTLIKSVPDSARHQTEKERERLRVREKEKDGERGGE